MFAVLVLEKEPLRWGEVPLAFHTWVLAAGAFAAVGILVWVVVNLLSNRGRLSTPNKKLTFWRVLLPALAGGFLMAALALGLHLLWFICGWYGTVPWKDVQVRVTHQALRFGLFYFLAGCALVLAGLPVLRNLGRLSARRIWALARLSMKEALRSRILWGFSGLLLVFLFASWFLPYKAEDQVRNYVQVVFFAMTVLLLLTGALLAAFSIPGDLRRQTIHTIVTKPVERFEIVLGRFLGFLILMTVVLAAISVLSLTYVAREIDEEAREESLKARVPIFGDLNVIGGVNVGKEWNYRRYIEGGVSRDRAVWTFYDVPASLGARDTVPCEFAFDIFRTTKGEENKGVYGSFNFENRFWDPAQKDAYARERDQERVRAVKLSAILNRLQGGAKVDQVRKEELPPDMANQSSEELRAFFADPQHLRDQLTEMAINNRLAKKFGFFQALSIKVVNYHTLAVDIPGTLFQGLDDKKGTGPDRPPFQVVVRFESPTQYLGMAKYDLYLLGGDRGFGWNFFKGALGIWFSLCLVIGIAVTCSTYLSGVISFLCTVALYLAGLCLPFIQEVAEGKVFGGGPLESLIRLSRDINPAADLDQTPTLVVAYFLDRNFSHLLRWLMYLIPDVSRFNLTDFVAEGFDISGSKLALDSFIPLAGYLIPWAVLAYYLVKSREIAS